MVLKTKSAKEPEKGPVLDLKQFLTNFLDFDKTNSRSDS